MQAYENATFNYKARQAWLRSHAEKLLEARFPEHNICTGLLFFELHHEKKMEEILTVEMEKLSWFERTLKAKSSREYAEREASRKAEVALNNVTSAWDYFVLSPDGKCEFVVRLFTLHDSLEFPEFAVRPEQIASVARNERRPEGARTVIIGTTFSDEIKQKYEDSGDVILLETGFPVFAPTPEPVPSSQKKRRAVALD